MSEEKRLMIENDLCMNKSKAQVIKLYLDLMEQYNKEIEEYQLELEKADSITQSCIFQGKQESEISFRNCLNKMTKYKTILDKIKEELNNLYNADQSERNYKVFIEKIDKLLEEIE